MGEFSPTPLGDPGIELRSALSMVLLPTLPSQGPRPVLLILVFTLSLIAFSKSVSLHVL